MAGEKRSKDQQDESLLKEDIIILDIEGTTTSITFVKEKLFPYVRENVKNYLDAKWEDEEFKRDLEKLKEQAKKDEEDKTEGLVLISGSNVNEEKESVVKNVLWQMDGDRKTGALKQLQGHMWREAYKTGKIKGHIYDDVPECLKSWKNAGKKIYVYSSGSIEAQKLLFGHSEHGDLLEYFSGYFDTEIGTKQEASSYKNILNQIKAEGSNVVFLTDVPKEAKAAKEAGLSTIIIIRDGNAAVSDEDKAEYKTARSFLDLVFASAAKRAKLETVEEAKDEVKSESSAVVEKMEVAEDDVEMKDVSEDKERKEKAAEVVDSVKDSKIEPETKEVVVKKSGKDNDEKKKETRDEADKDEAMETDVKPESVGTKIVDDSTTKVGEKSTEDDKDNKDTVKAGAADPVKSDNTSSSKVDDEGKSNNEESLKSDVDKNKDKQKEKEKEPEKEKEKEKGESIDEKNVSVEESDKAVIKDSKKLETTDKKVEKEDVSSSETVDKIDAVKMQIKDDSADVAMEEESIASSSVRQTLDKKCSTKVTNDENATETKTEGSGTSTEPKIKEKLSNTETDKTAMVESEPKPTSGAKEICTKPESSAALKTDDMETNKEKEKEKGPITDTEKKLSMGGNEAAATAPLKSEEVLQKCSKSQNDDTVKENGTSEASVSSASSGSKADVGSSKTDSEAALSAVTDNNKANENDVEMKKTEQKMEEESSEVAAVPDKKEFEIVTASVKSKEEKTGGGNGSDSNEAKKEIEGKDTSVDKSGEDKQSEKDNNPPSTATTTTTKTDIASESSNKESTTANVAAVAAAVEQTVKKINGATSATQQNGDDSTSNNDNDQQKIKIHTNGVNEACVSGGDAAAATATATADSKTNKEAPASSSSSTSFSSSSTSSSSSSPQKREQPESSTDPSAPESIKVKKVVDSTSVADGAGEPDVVPPAVVVAATS